MVQFSPSLTARYFPLIARFHIFFLFHGIWYAFFPCVICMNESFLANIWFYYQIGSIRQNGAKTNFVSKVCWKWMRFRHGERIKSVSTLARLIDSFTTAKFYCSFHIAAVLSGLTNSRTRSVARRSPNVWKLRNDFRRSFCVLRSAISASVDFSEKKLFNLRKGMRSNFGERGRENWITKAFIIIWPEKQSWPKREQFQFHSALRKQRERGQISKKLGQEKRGKNPIPAYFLVLYSISWSK